MDKFNELTTGAKLVLGAAIVFLIVSFFSWFDYGGPGEDELDAIGADTGITMWHGVGWIAGLLAIGMIVWQALRLANIEFEVGVTPSMITAALAVLLLIFTFIRWIDKPGGDFVDRTFWSWMGLALAIIIVVGPATGASLNPARYIGPMFVGEGFDATVQWSQLPAYFIGEFVGALAGAFAYLTLARTKPTTVPTQQTRVAQEVSA